MVASAARALYHTFEIEQGYRSGFWSMMVLS
jgi:hypothetical protein